MMGLIYSEFKEKVNSKEINKYNIYSNALTLIESFYSIDDIKFFYARNLFNSKGVELYFFTNQGYFQLNIEGDNYVFKQFNSCLVMKTLKTSIYHDGDLHILLEYDNGNSIEFKSIADSNEFWESKYAESIRQLYKVI